MKKKTAPVEPEEHSSEAPEAKQPKKQGDLSYVVKNKKARVATRHRRAITVAGIAIVILLLISGLVYGFYTVVDMNNFKIYVESSGSKRLSLSPYKNMMPASEMIELIGPERMTNTTLAKGKNIAGSVPIEDSLLKIINTEGSFTTVDDFYIAGTFYMQNVTGNEMLYGERINFTSVTPGAYRALRIMLIRNDEITVYAAPQSDGEDYIYLDSENRRIYSDGQGYYYLSGEERVRCESNGELQREEVVPIRSGYSKRRIVRDANGEYAIEADESGERWYAEFFYDEDFAVKNDNIVIAPNETVKYSVIIWFEGWDSDCVDDVIGDSVELTLSFCCN